MPLRGPILLIEDDHNDADVIKAAISELGVENEVKSFYGAQEAFEYLMFTKDKPLVILCDVRMLGLDGLAFLKNIHSNDYLRKKAIPFIFFTGIATQEIVNKAYE